MAENYAGNDNASAGLLRLLDALKTNIFRDLHVADAARIDAMNEDGTFTCTTITQGRTVIAYPMNGLLLSAGDVAVVLFVDSSFVDNFQKIKAGGIPKYVEDKYGLHQATNGIIIGTIYQITERE